MNQSKQLIILPIALLLTTSGFALSKNSGTITGHFKYKHAECTGQNQWIYVKGRELPIRFDTTKSNQSAIKALSALLPEVLGPNSNGKITLVGSYETRKIALPSGPGRGDPPGSFYHNFILSDWRIETPFTRMVITNPGEIPQEFRAVQLNSLGANEFNNCKGFDPKRFSSATKTNTRRGLAE
ncbi:MAG: hypothetical protein SGJ27_11480 [Candidatus Melainabacteria bacterium]|nr:hypothetical protein [Candidatus Melainabacteria bacterium]